MAQHPDSTMSTEEIAKDIANKTAMSLKHNLPVFIIAYYDHEADKLALLESIRGCLKEKNITNRTFDPRGHKDHGTGRLDPLLADASREKSLCLVSGLPLNEEEIRADNDFIHYLNIYRDRISKERIRMVLFLHSSDAEQFMRTAGDLWDFRHGTYWVEREKKTYRNVMWERIEEKSQGLKTENSEEILNHIQNVNPLIDNTEDPDEKARLFLDLTHWLMRRHAYSSAIETAYEAIHYTKGKRDSLRAEIENELGFCLRLKSEFSEALDHFKQSLEISQEIGDIAGEAVTCHNLAVEWERRKNIEKAIHYLKRTVEIDEQTDHPDSAENKRYLDHLIQKLSNASKPPEE